MNVLITASHPDDEMLGLGGTIARHVASGDHVTFAIIADGGTSRYDEADEAAKRLGVSDLRFAGFSEQMLDTVPIWDVTRWIEALMRELQPRVIYTHHSRDINRDHQVIHEATLTASRPYSAPYVERILCYETPSATEWAGPSSDNWFVPNIYVDITDHLETKLSAIAVYASELRPFPHPRSLQALRHRAAYWGAVIGVDAAEPFVLMREVQRSGIRLASYEEGRYR